MLSTPTNSPLKTTKSRDNKEDNKSRKAGEVHKAAMALDKKGYRVGIILLNTTTNQEKRKELTQDIEELRRQKA